MTSDPKRRIIRRRALTKVVASAPGTRPKKHRRRCLDCGKFHDDDELDPKVVVADPTRFLLSLLAEAFENRRVGLMTCRERATGTAVVVVGVLRETGFIPIARMFHGPADAEIEVPEGFTPPVHGFGHEPGSESN